MKEEKQKTQGKAAEGERTQTDYAGLPIVLKIKPGTAAEKSMRVILDDERKGQTVDEIIRYAVTLHEEDGLTRDSLRIQEKIGIEMRDKYGISVNGNAVKGNEQLRGYLKKETTPGQKEYLLAEIIIAARQEGARYIKAGLESRV